MSSSAKTIFITGASSGIGLASAQLFHARGWNVVASMRAPEKSPPELAAAASDRMLVVRLDLQDHASIAPALEAGIERFGAIDVLLNNAGYGQGGFFEAISREAVQAQFDVNVFGVMDVTRLLLPHFRARGRGGVINVSSGAGFWGLPASSMYSASKFALEGFTEALSYELAAQGVFVKSVVPYGGVTQTAFVARFSAGEFMGRIAAAYAKMVAGARVSAGDVAERIYEAATDGTKQLRYFIGDDARGFLKARYESRSDEEYMGRMRAYFDVE
ncbi:short-chain dehydrogenase reductase SDR [Leucogyrophana mollusca]|uniref:Short-chain dehydrogenase reductase SDR n=1 Tax=Leucogyrophana mollusca TaxID=85980 RepID=A0ACB8BJR6_9AGAM|nr:short-chain dehydrogenase reductase SDR [Leucogyrophana mollusca]